MRRNFTLPLLFISMVFFFSLNVSAQSCIQTGVNGSVVNLSCAQTCTDFLFKVPHLKSTSTYVVNTIPYTPFPYIVSTGGSEDIDLYDDDTYSNLITLPFPFCFYDSTFTKAVVGSNGLITFDPMNAGCANAYTMANTIPYAGGTQCNGASPDYYPKSSIMGMFTDLDPRASHAPADIKIQWRVEGNAPCRKFIVSYYHVGTYGDNCGLSIDSSNTFQMVMYESTSLIDVYVENKSCFSSTNTPGYGIMGVQNWNRNKAVAAPGKNLTTWTAHHEGFRFTPSGGISHFLSAGLYTLSGTLVANADTSTTTPGLLDIGFPNICPGVTTKYVIKTIFDGCPAGSQLISYDTITIVHINNLTATSTSTPSTCGTSVGTINATLTGGTGTPPFTYTLTPGPVTNTTGIFTGLAGGNYSISITDVNNCPVTISQIVGNISSLPSTISATGTTCPGVNNGTVTVIPTAGTAPYTFSINGGANQATGIFNNLPSGSYTVSFTDANGCTGTTTSITVIAGTAITSTLSNTAGTSCNGISDGGTTVTPTSGTGPYTYSIDGGTPQSNNVITGLSSGSHTITIKDATGCTGTKTVFISSGSGLAGTYTATSTSCPGVNNAVITVTPTNGVAPYTYSIDGGTFSPGPITGVSASVHTVTIKDANGCTGQITVVIIAGSGITATGVPTPSACAGINNGSIAITSTGTAPYSYSTDAGITYTPLVGNTIPNLAPGTYNLIIKDVNGCRASLTVIVAAGVNILFTTSSTLASCPGVNNATIMVTPSSGTAPYTYSINGGTTFLPLTGNTIPGVGAGIISVIIKDANGCTGTANVTVTAGSGITGTYTAVATSCPGVSTGSVTITATSGDAPYSYGIDAGTFQALNIFAGLSSGAHIVVIKDANGCTGNINVNVGPGVGITGSASAAATSCPGVDNGSVTVTPSTGTAPYKYAIDGGTLQTGNIFSGLSSGAHVATFQDANGCVGTVNVNVPVGAGITGTTSFTATSCPGVSNGSITVTPATGIPPYIYTLDGGTAQPGNVFNSVSSGAHVITFQDANGCIGTKNVTVTSGAIITATATTLPTTCPGVNNGSLTITAVTGDAPYTYSIDGGAIQAGNTFGGLASGAHIVTFQDANGCVGTKNVTVTSGAVITASATTLPTTCPGIDNGSLTITPITGDAPYTYSIDGGATQPSNTFGGLASGPHIVTFQDANGCVATKNVTVPSGALITATYTSLATACPGINNGSLTITPVTGTAPYTYSINGGAVQGGNIFTGLSAGPHIITFQDANGCVATKNATVPSGAGITGTASQIPTSCPGVSNGSVTITAVTGTAPYTYSIDGGTYSSVNTFNNLASGPHVGNFKDANGCIGTVNINVGPGVGITGSATAVATGCPGVNNGSITVNPITGTAPYTYTLDGGSAQAGNVFTGLAPGLHIAILTDFNGCSATVSATVNTGSGLASTDVVVGTSCPGVNNGKITLTPGTGTAPYLYSIDGGATQTSNIFPNLAAGSHTINFTDALGCTGTKSPVVPAGASLTSTVVPVNPPCANINDGTITISPTAGVAPYLYSLDAGVTTQTMPIFSNLAPGPYTISFSDAIGCKGTKALTLTTHTPVMSSVTFTKPLCNTNSNGVITVTGSGGVSPYKYSKDLGTTYQNSGTFSGLAAGTFTFFIKDNVGCISDTTVTLTEPTLLTATATSPNPETCAGNDGRIIITPAGGTPGYQYSINNGANYQNGNSFFVAQGNYPNIIVKDFNGCKAITSDSVKRTDNMFLNLGPDSSICVGSSVRFQPQTNAGTNIFHWSAANTSLSIPEGTIDNDTLKNATVTPADSFSYTLTAQWGICIRKDSINIFVKHKPVAFAGEDQAICINDSTAILTGDASNISGAINYVWQPAEGLETPFAATTLAILHSTTPYTLTVTDNYGCNFSSTDDVLVSLQPPVPAFAGNDTIAIPNVPHQLMASGGISYEWSPVSPLNLSTLQFPLATLSHDQQFVVSVTDVAGCIGTDTVFVKVYPGPAYHVPNAFSPNGDGLNDVFRVIPAGIASTEWFRVFNRYGELVFETNKWLQGWDGTYLGRKQPIGNYVWTLKGVDKNGKGIELKGTVLLVR